MFSRCTATAVVKGAPLACWQWVQWQLNVTMGSASVL